jgi:hypothetical protein
MVWGDGDAFELEICTKPAVVVVIKASVDPVAAMFQI